MGKNRLSLRERQAQRKPVLPAPVRQGAPVLPGEGKHKVRKLEKSKAKLTAKWNAKDTFQLFMRVIHLAFLPHVFMFLSLSDVLNLLVLSKNVRAQILSIDSFASRMKQHLYVLQYVTPFTHGDTIQARIDGIWHVGTYLRNVHGSFQITHDVIIKEIEYRNFLLFELRPLPFIAYDHGTHPEFAPAATAFLKPHRLTKKMLQPGYSDKRYFHSRPILAKSDE